MDAHDSDSHLFTVRLWPAPAAEAGGGWHGRVTHVLSGETRYFRDWPALIAFLSAALTEIEVRPPAAAHPEDAEGRLAALTL